MAESGRRWVRRDSNLPLWMLGKIQLRVFLRWKLQEGRFQEKNNNNLKKWLFVVVVWGLTGSRAVSWFCIWGWGFFFLVCFVSFCIGKPTASPLPFETIDDAPSSFLFHLAFQLLRVCSPAVCLLSLRDCTPLDAWPVCNPRLCIDLQPSGSRQQSIAT